MVRISYALIFMAFKRKAPTISRIYNQKISNLTLCVGKGLPRCSKQWEPKRKGDHPEGQRPNMSPALSPVLRPASFLHCSVQQVAAIGQTDLERQDLRPLRNERLKLRKNRLELFSRILDDSCRDFNKPSSYLVDGRMFHPFSLMADEKLQQFYKLLAVNAAFRQGALYSTNHGYSWALSSKT